MASLGTEYWHDRVHGHGSRTCRPDAGSRSQSDGGSRRSPASGLSVRTTPVMSVVARRADGGREPGERLDEAEDVVVRAARPGASTRRRIVVVRDVARGGCSARSSSRRLEAAARAPPRGRTGGRTRGTSTSQSRSTMRSLIARVRRRGRGSPRSASFSRTTMIGSPSRTLRSATTRPNQRQWSPTAMIGRAGGPALADAPRLVRARARRGPRTRPRRGRGWRRGATGPAPPGPRARSAARGGP